MWMTRTHTPFASPLIPTKASGFGLQAEHEAATHESGGQSFGLNSLVLTHPSIHPSSHRHWGRGKDVRKGQGPTCDVSVGGRDTELTHMHAHVSALRVEARKAVGRTKEEGKEGCVGSGCAPVYLMYHKVASLASRAARYLFQCDHTRVRVVIDLWLARTLLPRLLP